MPSLKTYPSRHVEHAFESHFDVVESAVFFQIFPEKKYEDTQCIGAVQGILRIPTIPYLFPFLPHEAPMHRRKTP